MTGPPPPSLPDTLAVVAALCVSVLVGGVLVIMLLYGMEALWPA